MNVQAPSPARPPESRAHARGGLGGVTRHPKVETLVIGAGPGGAITSMTLAEAGRRVVCLDQGEWVTTADRAHAGADHEWRRMMGDWTATPNVRLRDRDYPVETSDEVPLMWNGPGGSTNIYTGTWPRYRPSDFRKGTEHGLAPDWPIAYEDLEPHFQRADEDYGVNGLRGDPAMPERGPFQTRPHARGASGRLAAEGFDALGWHWWPMPTVILSEPYDGRPACNNCCGCLLGCPRDAIGNPAVTHWPRAIAAGAELRTSARVERIETDAQGRATGATYVDLMTKTRHFQPAGNVVLAANGIGTPRLLLMSASESHPNGLANASDQVGRNLMHHVLGFVEFWLDEPTENFKGSVSATVICEEFAETDPSRGFVNGITLHMIRQMGPGFQALGGFSGAVAPWGEGHHEWFDRHFGHGICVLVYGDDLPRPENRVTLSRTETDSSGLPAAKIDYALCENDERLIAYGIERGAELGEALGAFEIRRNDLRDADGHYAPPAWHLLGTARMGSDPATSVVDLWHRAWDCENLRIIDGSVMTTGGAINPTSTISALAYRAAERLVAELEAADQPARAAG